MKGIKQMMKSEQTGTASSSEIWYKPTTFNAQTHSLAPAIKHTAAIQVFHL
jgi:cytochrome c556